MRDIEPEPSNDSNLYEDELELWKKIRSGDEKAREEVIISYRPMVFWLASKLHVSPDSHQDLIQEGMVALIEAVDRYDFERGAKFITYAYYRVKGHMINFWKDRRQRLLSQWIWITMFISVRPSILTRGKVGSLTLKGP